MFPCEKKLSSRELSIVFQRCLEPPLGNSLKYKLYDYAAEVNEGEYELKVLHLLVIHAAIGVNQSHDEHHGEGKP